MSWSPYPDPPKGPRMGGETDEELRGRIANKYGKWGAFLTEVIESSGRALDACAKQVGLERRVVVGS